MTDKEIKKLIKQQFRTELRNWGINADEYLCRVEGSSEDQPFRATFIRAFNGSKIEIDGIYVDDKGNIVQWDTPRLI